MPGQRANIGEKDTPYKDREPPKTIPYSAARTYTDHIGEYPPPRGVREYLTQTWFTSIMIALKLAPCSLEFYKLIVKKHSRYTNPPQPPPLFPRVAHCII